MKKILCIAALLLLPSLGNATDVTWADKTTGGTFSAADANEVKSAVNSKADSTELATLDAKSVDQWVDNISVYENEVVLYDGKFYKCILTHLASSVTTPGVGGSWESAWEEVPVTGITIESDPVFAAWDKDYGDLINKPTIPTAINDFGDVDTTGKATGKVLKFNSSGVLVVGDDEIGEAGTGDITGVTAGTGLAGGGDTGAVTLSLSTATSDAIAANTAKISFDSASSTRLANTSGTNTGNQVASGVPFTPFGTISATTTQAAIEEVFNESTGGTDDQTAVEVSYSNTTSGLTAVTVQGASIGFKYEYERT